MQSRGLEGSAVGGWPELALVVKCEFAVIYLCDDEFR
jgi:hypothetical protein